MHKRDSLDIHCWDVLLGESMIYRWTLLPIWTAHSSALDFPYSRKSPFNLIAQLATQMCKALSSNNLQSACLVLAAHLLLMKQSMPYTFSMTWQCYKASSPLFGQYVDWDSLVFFPMCIVSNQPKKAQKKESIMFSVSFAAIFFSYLFATL